MWFSFPDKMMIHHLRWPFATGIVAALVAAGCQGTGPIEPTVIVLPTSTRVLNPTTIPITVAPLTAVPSATVAITPTELQTIPPRPIVATQDKTAEAPIRIVSNSNGATVLEITEAQLNAALKRHFDEAPLTNYADAPTVAFGDGSLSLTEKIGAASADITANAQTEELNGTLAIEAGALYFDPTGVVPLPTALGLSTLQIKLGHHLLEQTLDDIARTASGASGPISYNYASIAPDAISLTVVAG
ncbi:MAG TPA: hypothetical protein VKQ72_08815 [Aggregatilineales bacterium]|nr:hypothetical protein [Aggregatilineales bacterium]